MLESMARTSKSKSEKLIEIDVDLQLKPISKDGIPEAISKAELYRNLNEPGEAESICRDILAVDSENQAALRLLGLSITDQFNGSPTDRYSDAESTFKKL